jgi:hypothetical protein
VIDSAAARLLHLALMGISKSPHATVERLLQLGRRNAAVAVLRDQVPADAHATIKALLLSQSIDGPTAIYLITQAIPREHWAELGIVSLES